MENMKPKRREKEDKPVLAICYDFDKTLTPVDMQAQGYIQAVGYENVNDFWTKSNRLAEENDMDQISAYMLAMLEEAYGTLLFKRETLQEYGAKVTFFPGVESWFERIKEFGREHGVIVEHYVISSGLKEMIEGTSIAKNGAFEKIYSGSKDTKAGILKQYLVPMAITIGGVAIVMLIFYITLRVNGHTTLMPKKALDSVTLGDTYPLVPNFMVASLVSTAIYRKTKNTYLAAFVTALIVTALTICTNSFSI